MANPKLEFFRFKLNHKDVKSKTFRDFMVEENLCDKKDTDANIFGKLYAYFMDKPKKDFATNPRLQKTMTIIDKIKDGIQMNKHLDEKPSPDFKRQVISGVVNGGSYGKDRLMSNTKDKDNTDNVLPSQTVLQYYFVFLYFPLDHNEGFFMVHSDSRDESITSFFKDYVATLFQRGSYKKPIVVKFVPDKFQKEFRKGAVLSSMEFRKTDLNDQFEDYDDVRDEIGGSFDLIIKVTPNKKDVTIEKVQRIKEWLNKKIFGTKKFNHTLDESEKCLVHTANKETKTNKTFEWNNLNDEFAPVVYLDGKVHINEDGTPAFDELVTYCNKLFDEEILNELRVDKNVNELD